MVLANALKMIHKKTTANRRRYGFKYRSSRFNTTIGFSAVPVGEAVLTRMQRDIMSLYTNDTDTLRQMMAQSLPQFISSTITIWLCL